VCSTCGERLISPFALSAHGSRLEATSPEIDSLRTRPDEPRCGLCRRLEPPYVKATAYGSYESGLRELIHLLKYNQVRPAASVLGRMLAEAIEDLQPLLGDREILVVPVPLHHKKLRQREFNQSELIARVALKLKPAASLQLNAGLLQRCRETQSQIGLSRHQRRENVRGAFVTGKPNEIKGREILVVDDVFTTGTTVSECARILRRAGASKVYVATVARTLKSDAQHALQILETEAPVTMTMAAAG
jgi:ComF family protein